MEHNSDEVEIKEPNVDEMYSLGETTFAQSLHIDTNSYEMPTRTPGTAACELAAWTFSPIPVLSPAEPKITNQYRCFHSGNSNTPTAPAAAPGSEYLFNSVSAQDYYSMYQNQVTHDWHHLYQWYCTSNYPVIQDRSSKQGVVQNTPISSTYPPPPQGVYSPASGSSTDVNRCSTPELISALASITPDADVKPHRSISPLLSEANQVLEDDTPHCVKSEEHSPCQNDNVSVEYVHGTSVHKYHDSGYTSEMGMSPVYPYESKTPILSSADVSFDDGNKENESDLDPAESNLDPICHSQRMFTMSDYITGQMRTDEMLQKICDAQIQSSDVSSSNFMPQLPVNTTPESEQGFEKAYLYKPEGKPVICHKMPPLVQHKPNIKKCESAAKRKITDSEVQDQMQRESRRQRHNQPLNLHAVYIMTRWYEEHIDDPYPSKSEKEQMAKEGGITVTQVKSWFANKRNRSNNTKPKLQKRQMSERLMNICHQLARSSKAPSMNHADIIQQLSSIITNPHLEKLD